MKIIDKERSINIEEMLSSTTYETGSFPICVFCGKSVESNYFNYDGVTYQPLRCDCDGAKTELDIKLRALNVLDLLDGLNKNIDTEAIKDKMYEHEFNKLQEKYGYNLVYELRKKTGCGLYEVREALNIFNENMKQAYEYLLMKGTAVCRRKSDGSQWKKQDYIDWVKTNIE